MKQKKLWLLSVLCLLVCVFAVACGDAHTHTYTYQLTENPTETVAGKATATCSCGDTQTVDVPALTDTTVWTVESTTPATHTEAGSKVYASPLYGKVTVTLAKTTEHSYTYTLTTEPTETAAGAATKACDCGESTTVEVPALSDTSVWTLESTTPATHTETGSKVYASELYGKVTVVLAKTTEHSYTYTLTTEPTETATGTATKACACGESTTVAVPALSDTSAWTLESTTPATHTETGSKVYASALYGKVTVVLAKTTEHSYTYTLTTEPTETAAGAATKACACGDSTTVVVPALTDTTVWTVESTTPATHTEAGSKVYASALYGKVTVTIPKIAHVFVWTTTQKPTETTTGTATGTCSCGATDTMTLPVLTDTTFWTKTVVKAREHGVAGEDKYQSAYVTVTVTTPALDHVWGSWTITDDPTETTTGTAVRSCDCGGSDSATVPALSDTSVWTKGAPVPADYNHGTYVDYTSVYGTVRVEADDKLIPVYVKKTYCGLKFEAADEEDQNGVVRAGTTWNTLTLTIDENATGIGTGYPFRGTTTVTLIDAATGKLKFTVVPNSEEPDVTDTYYGYVDAETGIIIRSAARHDKNSSDWDSFGDVIFMTPFEVGASADAFKASAWTFGEDGSAMAIEYTFNETTYRAFILGDRVYFGVTFTDIEGSAITADTCYNHYVYVKAADGTLIASYGYDGKVQHELDGLEGVYNGSEGQVNISGFGLLSLQINSETTIYGKYFTAPAGADYALEVYMYADAAMTQLIDYGHVKYDLGAKTYTLTRPKVTITYNTGAYATKDSEKVTINVPFALATLTSNDPTKVFGGWTFEDGTPVPSTFIPTEDVTLVAVWKDKVVVTVIGLKTGDEKYGMLYLGVGDILFDKLPDYTSNVYDLVNYKKFLGWYIDVNGNGLYDEDVDVALESSAEIGEEDKSFTVIAVWKDLPKYYGHFYGTELWNSTNGNYTKYEIQIDEDGNIIFGSNSWTGTVISYDKTTQIVTYKKKDNDKTLKFYFNEAAGVIAGIYNSDQNIGNDFYIFTRELTATSYKVSARFSIKCKDSVNASSGYYAHLVTLPTKLGETTTVFLYDNHIYHNVAVTNSTGDPLSLDSIKTSKTVVVKDLTTDRIVFKVASTGTNLSSGDTTALDDYYGVYVNSDGTVKLDGTGKITWIDGKTGTYKLNGDHFDVYTVTDEKKDAYYTLTLNADGTFTYTKPMVNISFVVPDGKPAIGAREYNKNIPAVLPDATVEGSVFNGYFFDAAFEKPVPADFAPTEDVVLYAKYSDPATVSITYNNGDEDAEKTYSVGDIVSIPQPTYKDHRFLGWFTSSDFAEGTEWTGNNAAISADVHIYAKWGDPVKAYGVYYASEYERESTGTYNSNSSRKLTVDEEGNIQDSDGYVGHIRDYDAATKTIVLKKSDTDTRKYFYDEDSGLFARAYSSSFKLGQDAYIYIKGDVKDLVHYGLKTPDSGSTFVVRLLTYKVGEAVHTLVFVNDNGYVGVTITDAYGNALAVKDVKNSKTITVKNSTGNVILSLAANNATFSGGSATKNLDGLQGTYTKGEDTIVLDGAGNLTYGEKSGTYAKIASETNQYAVYLDNRKEYWLLTLDGDSFTMVKPTASITFETGFDDVTVNGGDANLNIAYALTKPTKDGYTFRGWYIAGEENTLYTSTYTAKTTDPVTLIAKWDKNVTLTVIYQKDGWETATIVYGSGDKTVPVEPTFTNGMVFDHWALDAEGTQTYTAGTAITADTTIYCIWKNAHALYGDYKGSEARGGYNNNSSLWSGSTTFSIDAEGNLTWSGNSCRIEDYDAETGFFKVVATDNKYYYGYHNAEAGFIVISAGKNNAATFDIDFYVCFRGATAAESATGCNMLSGKVKVFSITFTRDGAKVTKNFFFANDTIYYDVTLSTSDASKTVTVSNAYSMSDLTVKVGDDVVAEMVKIGGSMILCDGTQGTYTGILGEIKSNGGDTLTIGENTVSYVLLADGKIAFNYANVYRVAMLHADGSYEFVDDGFAGDYTLPDGTTTVHLDGKGNVTGLGTYTYAGTTLTIHTEDGSIGYGIDTENHQLLGKSVVAGLTYSGYYYDNSDKGNNSLKIIFDDSSAIAGTIYAYGTTFQFAFTGTYENGVLTLTITETNTGSGNVGKTVTATLSDDGSVLTITASDFTNTYTFHIGKDNKGNASLARQ